MKIEYIKSGVRIKSELFAEWNVFLVDLRKCLTVYEETVLDSESIEFRDTKTSTFYQMCVIGHKHIQLKIENHILDFDYVIEFQKIGMMTAFTFVGTEEHFAQRALGVDLFTIFNTFTRNKRAVREPLEFVHYD